jgi:hypothetical protein
VQCGTLLCVQGRTRLYQGPTGRITQRILIVNHSGYTTQYSLSKVPKEFGSKLTLLGYFFQSESI